MKWELFYIVITVIVLLAGCKDEEEMVSGSGRYYTMGNIYWTSRSDHDHDGYSTGGTLRIEVATGKTGVRQFLARLYYKGTNERSWTWVQDRQVTINPNSTNTISLSGFASNYYYGLYDFRLILSAWQPNDFQFYAELLPEYNPALNDQKFEYDGEDQRAEP